MKRLASKAAVVSGGAVGTGRAMAGTKRAIAHPRAAKAGSIINLPPIAGLIGVGNLTTHHASKGAVRLMTKNDAVTEGPEQTRVNSIHFGNMGEPDDIDGGGTAR